MRTETMLFAFLLVSGNAIAAGDAQRGARVFQACAACHSLEPGRNLTGPALSGLWGRKAGSLESFTRYSSEHCKDSYFVTTAAGETLPYWEFNLRFKTDSSASGPAPNAPVMVGQGMQGDRAQVVFSAPAEISSFIKEGC